jgi:hypothetical protein
MCTLHSTNGIENEMLEIHYDCKLCFGPFIFKIMSSLGTTEHSIRFTSAPGDLLYTVDTRNALRRAESEYTLKEIRCNNLRENAHSNL